MLVGGSINVDDNDLAAFPQRGPQPPQECIGLAHLMVHVDHEHPVEAIFGQAWIVFRPKLDRHVVQSLVLDAAAEPPQGVLVDVLREHASFLAHAFGKAHGVIALARPEVRDRHPGSKIGQVHHGGGFVPIVARLLRRHFLCKQRLQPPALIMIGEVIDADAALAALPQAVALTA